MHLMGGMTSSCYVRSFMLLQSNTSDVWLAYQETDGVDKVSGYRTLNNTLLKSNTVLSKLNTMLSELNTVLSELNTVLSELNTVLS